MKQAQKSAEVISNSRRKPALTPEERENSLISLTLDRVEERIRNGTATSQELCHFLKLATTTAQLEKEKLERENELLRAKTQSLESSERIEKLYADAIKWMSVYSGNGSASADIGEDDDEDENLF